MGYSSRTKGNATKDGSLAKFGYNATSKEKPDHASDPESPFSYTLMKEEISKDEDFVEKITII